MPNKYKPKNIVTAPDTSKMPKIIVTITPRTTQYLSKIYVTTQGVVKINRNCSGWF